MKIIKICVVNKCLGGDENTSMSLTSARMDTARDTSILGCRSLRDDTLGLPTDEPLVASTPYRHGSSLLHHSEVNLSSADAHYVSNECLASSLSFSSSSSAVNPMLKF